MIKNLLPLFTALLLVLSCRAQPGKAGGGKAGESTPIAGQPPRDLPNDAETMEINIKGDTLSIVSTADFLYYPFGTHKNEKGLNKQFPLMKKSVEYYSLFKDSPNEKIALYRFSFNHSFVKFLYDDEKKSFEIVSAKIFDREVLLSNGAAVGITKEDFIDRFRKDVAISPSQIKYVKVVELISGLDGVWQYYNFDNGFLTSIFIDTDYMVDKE